MRPKLLSQRFLWFGLGIRVLLIIVFAPNQISTTFGPFMESASSRLSVDPWSGFLSGGGAIDAFPYGIAMVLVFLPLAVAEAVFSLPLGLGTVTTLLLIELALLAALVRERGISSPYVRFFWISPIIPVATYILGFNDVVPLAFLTFTLISLRRFNPLLAGAFLALAVSAKLTALIATPLIALYFLDRLRRELAIKTGLSFTVFSVILWLPTLFSDSAQMMLSQSPDWSKVTALALVVDDNRSILLLPLALAIFFYQVWSLSRLNSELLVRLSGMAFLILVLLSPSSYGWFVLAMPLLAEYRGSSDKYAKYLVFAFSLQFVMTTALLETNRWLSVRFDSLPADVIDLQLPPSSPAILHTALVVLGLVIGLRGWYVLVRRDSFVLAYERPFAIGISGDSASGKDTLADAMARLLGEESTVKISGDDYHLWNRDKAIWSRITHLNPAANDLEGFGRALRELYAGRQVKSRVYDHQTGKLSTELRLQPNHFIISSGLHALYGPSTRELLDLKVFLDTDETLRRAFKFRRDTVIRGKDSAEVMSSIETRASDAERFIRPQMLYADIVFSLRPSGPTIDNYDRDPAEIPKALRIKSRNILLGYSLRRAMIGLTGLSVDLSLDVEGDSMTLDVEGNASSEDIKTLVEAVCPTVLPFLPPNATFEGGLIGIMQLVLLQQMSEVFGSRTS